MNKNIVEVDSHNEVVNFSLSKGLTLNPSKCVQFTVNQKSATPTPTLKIGDDAVSQVPKAKVVGDVINERGTNVDMIDDIVKRGLASMVSTLSVCNKVTMGMSFIESALLFHRSAVLQRGHPFRTSGENRDFRPPLPRLSGLNNRIPLKITIDVRFFKTPPPPDKPDVLNGWPLIHINSLVPGVALCH